MDIRFDIFLRSNNGDWMEFVFSEGVEEESMISDHYFDTM